MLKITNGPLQRLGLGMQPLVIEFPRLKQSFHQRVQKYHKARTDVLTLLFSVL